MADRVLPRDRDRIAGGYDADLRRFGDVDVEGVGNWVIDRPAGASGDGHVGETLPGTDIHDRDGARAGNTRISDVRGEEPPAPRIVGEPVRPDPHADLLDAWHLGGGEQDRKSVVEGKRVDSGGG